MRPEQTNPTIVGIIPRQAMAVKFKVTNGVQGKLASYKQTNLITDMTMAGAPCWKDVSKVVPSIKGNWIACIMQQGYNAFFLNA